MIKYILRMIETGEYYCGLHYGRLNSSTDPYEATIFDSLEEIKEEFKTNLDEYDDTFEIVSILKK